MVWLEALSYVVTILGFPGAIAVFVTLMYLATQVRQAREESRRALSQARTEANRELIALGLEDKILEANVKADMAFEPKPYGAAEMLMSKAGLSREEATRVMMVYVAYWNYVVQIVPVVESLGESERKLFDRFISNRFRSSGTYGKIYQFWTQKMNDQPEVITYVDNILGKHSSARLNAPN